MEVEKADLLDLKRVPNAREPDRGSALPRTTHGANGNGTEDYAHYEQAPGTSGASVQEVRPSHYALQTRRLSKVLGALLLILSAPFILLLWIAVRLSSRGPGFYRQQRVGKDGKVFTLYKLRSMYQDAERIGGPQWATPSDSRVTPVGRVLRKFHLDELPQLWNVVRGDMALIGPRPERPEIVSWLVWQIPQYSVRSLVRPGVTGLAQINLPPDETIECVRRKLQLDMKYMETASAGLDLRILACTAFRLLGVRHGRAVRWFRLQRKVDPTKLSPIRNVRFSASKSHTPTSEFEPVGSGAASSENGMWNSYQMYERIADAEHSKDPIAIRPR